MEDYLREQTRKFLEDLDFKISLEGDFDAQYFVLDKIDTMFHKSQFQEVDDIIKTIDINKYSEDVLVGFLSVCSLSRKFVQSKLPSYPDFYKRVFKRFSSEGEDVEAIMHGFDKF